MVYSGSRASRQAQVPSPLRSASERARAEASAYNSTRAYVHASTPVGSKKLRTSETRLDLRAARRVMGSATDIGRTGVPAMPTAGSVGANQRRNSKLRSRGSAHPRLELRAGHVNARVRSTPDIRWTGVPAMPTAGRVGRPDRRGYRGCGGSGLELRAGNMNTRVRSTSNIRWTGIPAMPTTGRVGSGNRLLGWSGCRCETARLSHHRRARPHGRTIRRRNRAKRQGRTKPSVTKRRDRTMRRQCTKWRVRPRANHWAGAVGGEIAAQSKSDRQRANSGRLCFNWSTRPHGRTPWRCNWAIRRQG